MLFGTCWNTPTSWMAVPPTETCVAISRTATSDEGVPTPSTSTATLAWPNDNSHAAHMNQLASSIGFHHPTGTLFPSESTVLFVEIQKASEEMAQVVGRFGPKMAATLTFPDDGPCRGFSQLLQGACGRCGVSILRHTCFRQLIVSFYHAFTWSIPTSTAGSLQKRGAGLLFNGSLE